MKNLNASLDNGQTEDNFFNFKSIKEYRGLYSLPDPEHLESSYNLLTEWDPGEKPWKSTTITIHDFKPCGSFKARVVIDGYLTNEPTKIVHSGAISLKNLKLAAEPINFQLWGTDDENAYFQALKKEKLSIVTVPEVEELQEHVLAGTRHSMIKDLEEHDDMITGFVTGFYTKFKNPSGFVLM